VDAQGSVQDLGIGHNGRLHGVDLPVAPDPEVRPQRSRRRFTAAYKQRIVAEAERCAPGELGALLRREGLYSSHLTKWRRQLAAGTLGTPGKRAGTPDELRAALQRVAKAERENRRLRQRLERAETIIDVQKKLSSLLQTPPPEVEH
jgi:transposase-like protein